MKPEHISGPDLPVVQRSRNTDALTGSSAQRDSPEARRWQNMDDAALHSESRTWNVSEVCSLPFLPLSHVTFMSFVLGRAIKLWHVCCLSCFFKFPPVKYDLEWTNAIIVESVAVLTVVFPYWRFHLKNPACDNTRLRLRIAWLNWLDLVFRRFLFS